MNRFQDHGTDLRVMPPEKFGGSVQIIKRENQRVCHDVFRQSIRIGGGDGHGPGNRG
ncbi:hypothetical protein D3C83_50030 [compost metagenome]